MSHSPLSYDEDREAWHIEAVRTVSYDVERAAVIGAASPPWIGGEASARIVVLDKNLLDAWPEQIRALLAADPLIRQTVVIDPDEHQKTVEEVYHVITAALRAGLQRRDEIVIIGGGVVLDIGGTAAAWLRKGIPYVVVPTTLVAMIDAGVGGKRAVNHLGRKNLLGAYHPARLSLIDPGWLGTTSPAAISAGLAEALKVAEMTDSDLFDAIEQNASALLTDKCAGPEGWAVISRATHGILTHLAGDLWESDLARWPDHGHTISPLLEMTTRGAVSHGQAVGIDCALSAALSHVLGLSSDEDVQRVVSVSSHCGVPIWHHLLRTPGFLSDAMEAAIKVRGGALRWPVMAGIGQHQFAEPTEAEVSSAVDLLENLVGEGMVR
jgi:3-dehydroquinate synthase